MAFCVFPKCKVQLGVFVERLVPRREGCATISSEFDFEIYARLQGPGSHRLENSGGSLRGGTHCVIGTVTSRLAPTSRWVFASTQPGSRGCAVCGVPTSTCSNLLGTSTPLLRFPKGLPAENSKLKRPQRMNPTSPILIRVCSLVGEGSLEFQPLRYRDQRLLKRRLTTIERDRNEGTPSV